MMSYFIPRDTYQGQIVATECCVREIKDADLVAFQPLCLFRTFDSSEYARVIRVVGLGL